MGRVVAFGAASGDLLGEHLELLESDGYVERGIRLVELSQPELRRTLFGERLLRCSLAVLVMSLRGLNANRLALDAAKFVVNQALGRAPLGQVGAGGVTEWLEQFRGVTPEGLDVDDVDGWDELVEAVEDQVGVIDGEDEVVEDVGAKGT